MGQQTNPSKPIVSTLTSTVSEAALDTAVNTAVAALFPDARAGYTNRLISIQRSTYTVGGTFTYAAYITYEQAQSAT